MSPGPPSCPPGHPLGPGTPFLSSGTPLPADTERPEPAALPGWAGLGLRTCREVTGSPEMRLGLTGRAAGPSGKGLGLFGMGPDRWDKSLEQLEWGWAGSKRDLDPQKGLDGTEQGVCEDGALAWLGKLVQLGSCCCVWDEAWMWLVLRERTEGLSLPWGPGW